MRLSVLSFLSALSLTWLLGCRTPTPPLEPAPAAAGEQGTRMVEIVTGKVLQANPAGRFVLISFPPGLLPAPDLVMDVHRSGAKVGEVRISPQQQEDLTVADIVSGEAAPGDRVRSKTPQFIPK